MSASACACAASTARPASSEAREALALVGLAEAFDKKPHQLSGGQRQRVALARALVVEPAVLLLDEPLGALDLKLRRQMQDELKAIQKRVGTAFVHVTHDQEEAMALADHCVVMNDGRIEDEGPPERVYARPATRFAAAFMGESTLIAGTVVAGDAGRASTGRRPALGPLAARSGDAAAGDAGHAGDPAEHLQPSAQAGRQRSALGEATVVEIVFQGSFKRVLADLAASTRRSASSPRLPATAAFSAGDIVAVSCRADDVILLTQVTDGRASDHRA